MALQYVGGTSGAGTSTGYTISLSGTLTGGIASSPAAGDYIVVFSAFGNTAASAPAVSGNNNGAYTGLHTAIHANDTWDTEFLALAKVQGSTPDTTLTVTRVTNAAYGGSTVVQVWRGINTTTQIDVTTVTTSGTNGAALNPPSITPVTAGAVVIAGGAGTMPPAGTAGYTAISGMSNVVTRYSDGTTADTSTIMASFAWTSGAYDPAAATGGTQNNTSSSWAGVSLVLRPALDPRTGTLAATEASTADTFAGAGDVIVQGGLSVTESATADTFAASGTVTSPPATITGTLAATETGSDTFSATGDVIVKGTLSVSETGADTFASTGKVVVRGALTVTETGADTFAAVGDVIVKGSLAATETGADTFSAAGDVFVKGTLAATETGSDTFAATGGGVQVATGTLAATESGADTFAAVGDVIVRGSLAVSEAGSDTFTGAGDVIVKGTLAVTESGADTLASTGKVIVKGSLAATETGQDTFVGNGGAVRTGDLAATESGSDTFAATGSVIAAANTGSMSATEAGADTFGGYAAGYVEPGYAGGVSGTVSNGVTITGAQAVLLFKIYKLHGLWTQPLVVSPTSRVAGDLTQTVSGTTTVTVSTTAGDANLSGNVGTMIEELAALHGLTADLVTTATSRTAGSISQTFSTVGSTTTVTRA